MTRESLTREKYYSAHHRFRYELFMTDSLNWMRGVWARRQAPMTVLRTRKEPDPAHYATWEAFARFIRRYPGTGLKWETVCKYRWPS